MIRTSHPQPRRRGIVMIVVVTMLAFFSVVALGFVYFAESEATTSNYSRQASAPFMPDVQPELLASHFMGAYLYGTNDTSSCVRGLSQAENMYGYAGNAIPFTGTGQLSTTPTGFRSGVTLTNIQALNPIKFSGDTGVRATEPNLNAPYTYPDRNNPFLAAVTADGKVLLQSGHRPGWTGSNFSSGSADQMYRTLRPHISYHPSFPQPADVGGDVKNLPWGLGANGGVNDSYWMDFGFPVQTAPDGRKYKPLFAPLMISLDSRLNLVVTGNFDQTTQTHLSGAGLGRWEINLGRAFSNPVTVLKAIQTSRFGADGVVNSTLGSVSAPVYAPIDLNMAAGANKVKLPVAGDKTVFPKFPTTSLSGTNQAAKANHPGGFSPRIKVGDDVNRIAAANLEALLNYGGTNSSSYTSDLPALLAGDWNNPRARNLITTLSNSLDRPGLAPMFTANLSTTSDYKMAAGDAYPNVLKKYPKLAYTPGTSPGGDFSPQWQSTPMPRLDLNRKLPDYPAKNAAGIIKLDDPRNPMDPQILATQQQYKLAVEARRQFAKDIYDRFVAVTGARTSLATSASDPTPLPPTDDNYRANRYLAQLAINIVDYLDADDISTSWSWNPLKADDVVFGTELPKVVINEAYIQLDNDPADPGLNPADPIRMKKKATYYQVNSWVELFNPMPAGMDVTLKRNDEAAYRLLVAKPGVTFDPIGGVQPGDAFTTVDDWDATANQMPNPEPNANLVRAGDQQTTGNFFYLLAPKARFVDGHDPKIPATPSHATGQVSFKINDPDNPRTEPLSFVLQRLANPLVPFNDTVADIANPAKPYNPYVTIDYLSRIPVNDNRQFNGSGDIEPTPNPNNVKAKKPSDFSSSGRQQPYVASTILQVPAAPGMDQPKHTFGDLNKPSHYDNDPNDATKFKLTWLVHLDRQLQNVLELKYVSAFPMHQLTQKFWDGSSFHKHLARWDLQETLLFRAFELFAVADRSPNNVLHGQIAGKININEVWDPEILLALLDAQPGSNFTDADVQTLFNALKQLRDGGGSGPNVNSKPFMGFGAAVFDPTSTTRSSSNGMSSTLLGVPQAAPAAGTHPYLNDQILTKGLNNATFTSNTFALWVTVGFFEVTDDTVVPAKLGDEMGRKDNRHVRHRFFAVIDRTEMVYYKGTTTQTITAGQKDVKITLDRTQMTPTGQTPTFRPGMMVEVGSNRTDVATNDGLEAVHVKTGGPGWFTADFQNNHQASSTQLLVRGYAGPVPRYDVTKDNAVVPHFSIIE